MPPGISAIKAFCKRCNTCKLKNLFVKSKQTKPLLTSMRSLRGDVLQIDQGKLLRSRLQSVRDAYIKDHPDAFMTLDHIKSNYDNSRIISSVKGQTKALDAVSTEDFSNLSEIMKGIRTPEEMTVYRAMEGGDFNIGSISPEEFFAQYYKEGKTVTVPIYMSTSLDPNIAFRFAKKNPNRFIIKLKVPKDTPAVYMENLAPGDGAAYGYEDELNIIRNATVRFGKVTQKINPLNNQKVYELEGTVVGFRDVPAAPQPEFQMDEEMMELMRALQGAK